MAASAAASVRASDKGQERSWDHVKGQERSWDHVVSDILKSSFVSPTKPTENKPLSQEEKMTAALLSETFMTEFKKYTSEQTAMSKKQKLDNQQKVSPHQESVKLQQQKVSPHQESVKLQQQKKDDQTVKPSASVKPLSQTSPHHSSLSQTSPHHSYAKNTPTPTSTVSFQQQFLASALANASHNVNTVALKDSLGTSKGLSHNVSTAALKDSLSTSKGVTSASAASIQNRSLINDDVYRQLLMENSTSKTSLQVGKFTNQHPQDSNKHFSISNQKQVVSSSPAASNQKSNSMQAYSQKQGTGNVISSLQSSAISSVNQKPGLTASSGTPSDSLSASVPASHKQAQPIKVTKVITVGPGTVGWDRMKSAISQGNSKVSVVKVSQGSSAASTPSQRDSTGHFISRITKTTPTSRDTSGQFINRIPQNTPSPTTGHAINRISQTTPSPTTGHAISRISQTTPSASYVGSSVNTSSASNLLQSLFGQVPADNRLASVHQSVSVAHSKPKQVSPQQHPGVSPSSAKPAPPKTSVSPQSQVWSMSSIPYTASSISTPGVRPTTPTAPYPKPTGVPKPVPGYQSVQLAQFRTDKQQLPHTDQQTYRGMYIDRQTYRKTVRHTDRWIDRHTDR